MSDEPQTGIEANLIAANLSTAREKVLEHRLVSDLAVLMLRRGVSIDVLRSEFDAQGHDVVLEAAGVIRHVQLKATVEGGKRQHVDINVRLRAKPSGCIIWMTYEPITLGITAYRWFGGMPGEPLPDLGDRITRHSRGNAGQKAQRPALRNLPKSRFEPLLRLDPIADRLFGPARSVATSLVLAQLRQQFGNGWRAAVASETGQPDFNGSLRLAHLVDGYGVLEQLCELDPLAWLECAWKRAIGGQIEDDLGILWTQLFLEHRRWRQASPHEPQGNARLVLDQLASRLDQAIRRELAQAF
jgi:hypothetical protein